MNLENENPPIEPALNGDEPSASTEDVSVEPNGHEKLPAEEQTPGAAEERGAAPAALVEEPVASEEPPAPEALAAAESPAESEQPPAEPTAQPEPEPAPEPAPVTEAEVVAAAATEEPVPAEEPDVETPAAAADVPVDGDEEQDASSIAADIQKMLAEASASARASAEAAERAAVDADIEVAVAVAEPEVDEAEADGEEGEEGAAAAAAARIFQPGDWFVVHTYAGYENKVKANLNSRISSMNMEEKIFEVTIPMEDVMEIKSGKKQVVQRKVFPGYLLVRMDLDDDSWYVVRNTPGVTGFVGSGTKPIPLSEREVDRILQRKAVGERPKPKLEWSLNDPVRVTTGPFANFQGLISEIDTDRSKLKVLVNIFGRETPVELGFDQVAKV
jgi:transcription termination/antitermination protein NusG